MHRARCCSTFTAAPGAPSSPPSSAFPLMPFPRSSRRTARSRARIPRPSSASTSPSPASPATSRPHSWARPASHPGRRNAPTARDPSSWSTREILRWRHQADCSRQWHWADRMDRSATPLRGRCSSRDQRSSGCATDSRSLRARARRRPSRSRCRTAAVSSSCPRSPVSAHPIGIPMRAA